MRTVSALKALLWVGAAFFLFEAILHAFGLPVLDHDKIFIPTHDRYIAIFALTEAALLILVSTDAKKYRTVFFVAMSGIALGMLNAFVISRSGGYLSAFSAPDLDGQLAWVGGFPLAWYALVWGLWAKRT